MTQAELLRHLVDTLEALGAEYMIGGSQAAIYYGEPRLTRDVDVFVNPDTPYDRARRSRRRRLPLLPTVTAYFASAEDVILYKLLYYRQVESGSHLRDVLGILSVSGPLDESYIREWADQLGLRSLWEQIRKQAE
jgi:hypothetical protein